MSKSDGYFRCRDYRRVNDVTEQRWFCAACGARTVWHLQTDEGEVLSAAGFSTGFFDGKNFDAYCSACKPPSGETETERETGTDMAKANGHANGNGEPDRSGKTLIKLSREDREERGQNLAHERELFKALRKKKRTHVGEWNEQLRQMEETIDRLAEEVETGEAWVDSNLALAFDKKAAATNKAIANGKKAKPAKAKKAKSREARA